MSEINLNFYPWLRRGLAQALTNPQPAADPAITATVYLNREPLRHQLTLRGPGDVVGLSRAQVVRTEPTDGTRDFEYAFSRSWSSARRPAVAVHAGGRIRPSGPWLVLVVVKASRQRCCPCRQHADGSRHHARTAPSLAESWAWAHVQRP